MAGSRYHYTLGIAFTWGHGTSGCIARDGHIVAATCLERILHLKYAWMAWSEVADEASLDFARRTPQGEILEIEAYLPRLVDYLLDVAGIGLEDLDLVVYDRCSPATSPYRVEEVRDHPFLVEYFAHCEVLRCEHHMGHLAQAFYPSPFDEAAILSIDGGSWETLDRLGGVHQSSAIGVGRGKTIEVLDENIGHGVSGKEYMRATLWMGFHLNEEGKTMGLAPYGTPDTYQKIRRRLKDRLRGRAPRKDKIDFPSDNFRQLMKNVKENHRGDFHSKPAEDLAWAVQKRVEERILAAACRAHELTGLKRLCYAGGVALNSVANWKILQETPIEEIFIYPNAGDCGLAAGYCLWGYHQTQSGPNDYVARNDYLGRSYSTAEIEEALQAQRDSLRWRRIPKRSAGEEGESLEEVVAGFMADGKIFGWFQGGAEFGPRALGNRSILCDPRTAEMKDVLNAKVKHREGYRPFAPAVLRERCSEYFEMECDSPVMLLVPQVREEHRNSIPAITHVDGSARVQTTTREDNGSYHDLIEAFGERTGVPVILNTSFNLGGKPIVETPAHAIDCFLGTHMDYLVLEDFLVEKVSAA